MKSTDASASSKNPLKALIFDIKKFAVHDGPGIRTTVFFKGCNLRCVWCHNPESIHSYPEIAFFEDKCIACGNCFKACKTGALRLVEGKALYEEAKCTRCGSCTEVCYAEARFMYGKWMTLDAVLEEIMKDKPFYDNSGGGATFSGGEPLLQAEFVAELARLCHANGVTVAVDTAASVPWSAVEMVLPHTDYFLVDLKIMDSELHRKHCGTPVEMIHDNLRRLSKAGARIVIRVPVIPGYTDSQENLRRIAEFAHGLKGVESLELLPYHGLGESKYRRLGRQYLLSGVKAPPRERLEELAAHAQRFGLLVKIEA